ncbi:MAG TPA: Hsp20/alpha crystallin family protein [Verrucomicrobiae bacterium]|jgi:HSP20 family protein|nr:Hsp20/alpha crystallin family protein [Verrucomicrobiae bacterium]
MIVRQLNPWGPNWNHPGSAYAQMRRDMDSLLERLSGVPADGSAAGVFPPMNVSEDPGHYYIRALIPGIDASQLNVSVVHQTVTVSGARQSPEEEGVSYHRKERAEGAFSRSVTLPASFDGARVDAKYVDGILTLTLPKPEAAKPRRVTVQTS